MNRQKAIETIERKKREYVFANVSRFVAASSDAGMTRKERRQFARAEERKAHAEISGSVGLIFSLLLSAIIKAAILWIMERMFSETNAGSESAYIAEGTGT